MVKVYVELVVDIHLPGKLTRAEERRGEEEEKKKGIREGRRKCKKSESGDELEKGEI